MLNLCFILEVATMEEYEALVVSSFVSLAWPDFYGG